MSIPDTRNAPSHPFATSPARSVGPAWSWVPIRSLGPRHRERITSHLLALETRGRCLRFGYLATDAQISRYVDMLDFEQDEVFGIFSRRLELLAMAHLAHSVAERDEDGTPMAEFGVSVLPQARNRGFGRRLFKRAMLHARNRGAGTLLIHALSENTAMLKIACHAGASVVREGPESDARLRLPPDTLGSHVGELVERRGADLDYRLKLRAHQVGNLLGGITTVKASLAKSPHVAQE